jgi:hypothetical protein
VGDPAVVINWFPVVIVLQVCFLLKLLMGESFSFFFIFSFFSTVASCVLFSSWFSERSSSVFSRLLASPLVLVTRFVCGLSFRVFCAESFTLLLISLIVFCVIIFRLMAFFVEFKEGSVFLLSASLSMSPIFFFIYFVLFYLFFLFLLIVMVSLVYFPLFVTFSFSFSE